MLFIDDMHQVHKAACSCLSQVTTTESVSSTHCLSVNCIHELTEEMSSVITGSLCPYKDRKNCRVKETSVNSVCQTLTKHAPRLLKLYKMYEF